MRLWTIQPLEVLEIIKQEGEFVCNPNYSDPDFKRAYHWLVKQMDNRGIEHPYGLELPIWAWYKTDWENKKPDLEQEDFSSNRKNLVCIELEINDKDVLLTDFYAWHYVLNDSFLDSSHDEKEWDLQHEWYDALAPEKRQIVKEESWNDIFNITPTQNEWIARGREVQAIFWKITKEMIKGYESIPPYVKSAKA